VTSITVRDPRTVADQQYVPLGADHIL